MGAPRSVRVSVLPRRLPPGSRLWLDFRVPERADSRRLNHGRTTECSNFSAPQTSPSRVSALAGFPSPRESQQWSLESSPHHGGRRFQCSPDVSLQDLGSGWISEPQRGPTVAVLIMGAPRQAPISVLSRRLTPGCRLWLDFRAPERADSSRWNLSKQHGVHRFSAPQTSHPRMSALAGFPSPREGRQ